MTASSHRAHAIVLAAAAWTALAAPGELPAQGIADERASYSYVRTLEGAAVLSSDARETSVDAELHEPLLQGDLVTVEAGARVEIALADRSLLRIAGGSSVRLTRVAFSADRDDRTTRLDLDGGEILLSVGDDALGDELPEIRTPVATIYVHEPGTYRIEVTGDTMELVVREGFAEVLTDRGSTVVRAGEAAWTTGDRAQRVEIADAGPEDALELWGADLELDVQTASSRELRVEPELAYAAAPLATYGSWISVDTSWYWRPRVAVGWRPYWDGRWAWTPSGLTWVSYEPWGWVPYHYGTWTFLPHYGWAWRPGRVYSPAWVYWNIGPTWTGWCPTGYYTDYYRPYGYSGFNFGVYGWSGGSWGFYADWNFSLTVRVFDRHPERWRHSGFHLARTEGGDLARGVLTTDTAALPRERWSRPRDLVDSLAQRGRHDLNGRRDLPDVSQFVARRRELPPDVRAAVVGSGRGRSLERGTPPGRETASRAGLARPGDRPSSSRDAADRGAASAEARGRSGRDARAPQSLGTPRGGDRVAGEPSRATAGAHERRAAPPSAAAAADRQGWRSREGHAPAASRPTGSVTPRAVAPSSNEPVQRVIGGMRRGPGASGAPARPSASVESSPQLERGRPTSSASRTRPGVAAPDSGYRGSGAQHPRPTSPRAGASAPSAGYDSPRTTARPPQQQRATAKPPQPQQERATARPPQQQRVTARPSPPQQQRATARPPQQQQRVTARPSPPQQQRATAKPSQPQQRGGATAAKPAGGGSDARAGSPPPRERPQSSAPARQGGSGNAGHGGKKGNGGG